MPGAEPMKIITKLQVESDDNARLNHMDDAYYLIGGMDLPEEERKIFGRIRGNDFTLADVQYAMEIVKRRAGEMAYKAATEQPFPEATVNRHWSQGVVGSAELALRQARQFYDDLQRDIEAASLKSTSLSPY